MQTKKFAVGTILIFSLFIAGCGVVQQVSNFNSKPSDIAKKMYREIEAGNTDAFLALVAEGGELSEQLNTPDKKDVSDGLAKMAADTKARKGIASVDIQNEEIKGDNANVNGNVRFNDGSSAPFRMTMVKQNGAWKILSETR